MWLALTFLFILLLMIHFCIDLQFQTNEVAKGKDPKASPYLGVPWPYWMLSHASTHGLGVMLATQSLPLGIAETVVHFFIDVAKCKGYTAIHLDQFLHVVCKATWIGLIAYGVR